MGDALFVLKCFAVTVVLVVFMQIRVGGRTLEHRAMSWIHNSSTVDQFRMAAEGAVKVTNEGWDSFSSFTKKHVGGLFTTETSFFSEASFEPLESSDRPSPSSRERKRARSANHSDSGPMGPEID